MLAFVGNALSSGGMLQDDFPMAPWQALCPDETPSDVEMLAPRIWRVGDRVLKQYAQVPLAQFRRIVRAHRQAGRMLRSHEGLDAQKLLEVDETHRVLLLAWVEGRSGRMELIGGADPDVVLARAARWLVTFHTGRELTHGAFDANGAVARLAEAPGCGEADMFDRARAALTREAARLQGREVGKAVLHGDMTLANLLYTPDAVTGIDFENLAHHPAARDAGELWADLLLHAPRLPRARSLLPEKWERAFVDAYPGLDADVCAFYARHRLLRAWSDIPAQEEHRGPGRARKLANLMELVRNGAFGVGVLG